ncbi:MAG: HipA N-terminal domain-containing protein [Prevotella sp.]|nr:HipA N-terminal domain-containing protein [Prevotella sp.]
MRKVAVYFGDIYAGRLTELARNSYEFAYNEDYLADKSLPPVSVNLPKTQRFFPMRR